MPIHEAAYHNSVECLQMLIHTGKVHSRYGRLCLQAGLIKQKNNGNTWFINSIICFPFDNHKITPYALLRMKLFALGYITDVPAGHL